MPGRAGVDGELLVTVRVVDGSSRCLQTTTAELCRQDVCRVEVVHVQVKVHLLLLRSGRPLGLHVIGRMLDAQHPFAADHDASSRVVTPPKRPAQNLLSLSMSSASMTMTRRSIFTLTPALVVTARVARCGL